MQELLFYGDDRKGKFCLIFRTWPMNVYEFENTSIALVIIFLLPFG